MGTFLGIALILLTILFVLCSCKVASWADQDMDDILERRINEKENIYKRLARRCWKNVA